MLEHLVDQLAGGHHRIHARRRRVHAIVGTLIRAWSSAVISVPIGVFDGDLPGGVRPRHRLGKLITFMVDILTGVPSIVAALFIYALWVTTFGFQRVGSRCRSRWCC